MIRQLISAREYTKPVRFFASVDARKRLKPASTEDGYKPFCSVDRPLVVMFINCCDGVEWLDNDR